MSEKKRGFLEGKVNKFFQNKIVRRTTLISLLVIVLLAIIIFVYNFAYREKIFPRTFVGSINLGGKTKEQALEILSNKSENSSNNQIELKYLDKTWLIKTQDIDLKYDDQASVDMAWKVGRSGKFGQIIVQQLKSVFLGNRYLAEFIYSRSKLNSSILEISNKIDIPEKDATVTVDGQNLDVKGEQTGQKLDFIDAQGLVLKAFGNFKLNSQGNLNVVKIQPKVTRKDAENAKTIAQKFLQQNITLKSEKKTYTIEPKDIVSWFVFVSVPEGQSESKKLSQEEVKEVGKNTEKKPVWTLAVQIGQDNVSSYVSGISSDIYQEPKDAKFKVEDGKVITFQFAQTGYNLDQGKSVKDIITAIKEGLPEVSLSIKVTQPELSSSDPAQAGITELIGEGKTSWRGSPSNRIHNLSLGTEKISGTIVKPGQEFSTVKTIGEIGPATGFLPELVIKNSTQVVPEYGGGLCQVSTTLFRAVIYSGLKVTDRTPHSFRVSYYEPPVGMDATIYDPAPDLKFINDMSTPILIWGIAGNNGLTFQIYGTKDGRNIEISDPVTYDYVSPPGAVYTESDSMAPGEIRQVERALAGCTASFHYKVTDASGKVLENETFVSKYVALPNSYYVGPGTEVPPPEGG